MRFSGHTMTYLQPPSGGRQTVPLLRYCRSSDTYIYAKGESALILGGFPAQRSPGVSPVRFAIRESIRGPISSVSWNAKTKSGQPSRLMTLCEVADCRLTVHPIRIRALNNLDALVEDHILMMLPRRFRRAQE